MEIKMVVTRGFLACSLLCFGSSTAGIAQSASHEESTSPVDYVRSQADNPELEPAVRKMAREALPKTDESKEASKKNGVERSNEVPGMVTGKSMPKSVRSHKRTASVPVASGVKQPSTTKRAVTPEAKKVAKKESASRSGKASPRAVRTRRPAVKSSTKKSAQKKVAAPAAPSAPVSVAKPDAKKVEDKKPVAKKLAEKPKAAVVDTKKEAESKAQVMHDGTAVTASEEAHLAEIARKKAEIAKRKKDLKEQSVAPFAPVAKKAVTVEDATVAEKHEKSNKKSTLSHSPSVKKLETKEGKDAVDVKTSVTSAAKKSSTNGKSASETLKKMEKKGDIKLMEPISEETVVEVDEEEGDNSSDAKDTKGAVDNDGVVTDALDDGETTVV